MQTANQHPKLVVIGAGSLFFGRKLIWAMNHLQGLTGGHLVLVDTDPQHLEAMERLAVLARESTSATYAITATADFREALPGADFVLLSFSRDNAHYRGVDVQISAECGIRMCSGDTIGPGGIFRAFREFAKIDEIANAVREVCPDAWLINYINPSAVFGIALSRMKGLKNLALCDSLHLPHLHHNYLKMIDRSPGEADQLTFRIAGVNHFTFLLEATLGEEDILPQIHQAMRILARDEDPEAPAKARFNLRIAAQLGDIFGVLPMCTAHTKEYLPYYQGYGPFPDKESVPPLTLFEHDKRQAVTAAMWEEVDGYTSGRTPINTFHEKYTSDHATDLIQAMWNDSGRHLYVNIPNRGTVPNLPDDAVLELEAEIRREGPVPVPCPQMPRGLRALQMQIIDTHELTVDAWYARDRNLVLRALATDPIVNSLATAEEVLKRLYEAQKDVLPGWLAPPEAEASELRMTTGSAVEQGQTREGT